jgi:hypothetical protein
MAAAPAPSQELGLQPADLRIEQRGDGGYHLYIRAKSGIGSVLLTETTKDPAKKADNYAYRTKDPNPVTGEEKRLLDGAFIEPDGAIHSLIDSSPEADPSLGQAFHVFIPYVVQFGYAWTRNGEIFVSDGTFVNLRTFAKAYADYTGAWRDNPFQVRVSQKPLPGPPEGNYLKDTVKDFKSVSEGGEFEYALGKKDLVPKMKTMLERAKGKSLDLVICLDTTDSMSDDIDEVKKSLVPMIESIISEFREFRLGMVLYKDYFEEYLTKRYGFTRDMREIQHTLGGIRVWGGRDIPEAVNEALYSAATEFAWSADERMIILIGDAPAHPIPRGSVSEADAKAKAAARDVKINAIILPQ